ncbi:MAG: zinc ABC transporter substrate-binding protein [Thermodesulfovibrionales bacterium]|nr:zinc ABC transporter substrate-binding protein [Thermodesulfovibrionales bacterium]
MRRLPYIGKHLCAFALVLAAMFFAVEAQAMGASGSQGSKVSSLEVRASFGTLAHFAGHVAGERATVLSVAPPGADPHEFEPSARALKGIYDSDVFIFQGAGLDPWASRISRDLRAKGVIVLDMASAMRAELDAPRPMRHALDLDLDNKNKQRGAEARDPHFWLDPVHAASMVLHISDALSLASSEGRQIYEDNAFSFIREIRALDQEFRKGLMPCRLRDIVVSHDAYSYLGRRYGFEVHPISGVSPQEEPSPKRLASLVELMRKKGIGHVFGEPGTSARLTRALADETGAEVLVLDPLGALAGDDTYLSVMRNNLDVLRQAMRCDHEE